MRGFVICGGIHGDPEGIARLERVAAARHPDGILVVGGILAPGRSYAVRSTPWCLTTGEARFIEDFFAALGRLKVFSAGIPGPAGEPMDEFYRLAMAAELTFPNVHVVHATLVEKGGVAVCGIGGTIAEEPLQGAETYTRTKVEYLLRPLRRSDQPRKVLLLAAAPSGSSGWPDDKRLAWELIDSLHPDLCVVYAPGDRPGTQTVGKTLVINPGCLADGRAAWLDWGRDAKDQAELLDLAVQ
jgi:Icc-related predicted phosphoesterase